MGSPSGILGVCFVGLTLRSSFLDVVGVQTCASSLASWCRGLAGSPAASLEELDLEFKGLSAACAAPLGQLARALPSLRRLTLARKYRFSEQRATLACDCLTLGGDEYHLARTLGHLKE